jgi:hypothetical protein
MMKLQMISIKELWAGLTTRTALLCGSRTNGMMTLLKEAELNFESINQNAALDF